MTAILVKKEIFTMIRDASQLVLMVFTVMLKQEHAKLVISLVRNALDHQRSNVQNETNQNSTYFQENRSEHWQLV